MRGRFFGPGEVRVALLALLAEQPRHGYDLMRELEERSGGAYRASAGTIYPTLQQLEDEGLVSSERENGKRVYRLTEAGQRESEAGAEDVQDIWRRSREWRDWRSAFHPDTAELRRPVMRLMRAAFRVVSHGEDDPDRVDRVREILERAREELDELRHEGAGSSAT
jgi:DNA-binding PadR family transcriptional regulator